MNPLETFRNDGIAIVRNAIPHDVIDRSLEQIEKCRTVNYDWLKARNLLNNDRLFRVVNLHMLLPALREILAKASPEAHLVTDSLGGKGTLYTSLYFESGSEQTYHRDTPYFWTNPPLSYLGFWTALEDVDESNGPLRAILGSHKLGEPDCVALRKFLLDDKECPSSHTPLFDAYNEVVYQKAMAHKLTGTSLHVKKGDVIFWNASTLHGGSPHINKERSRKSFVMHITPRDVPVMHMQYFFHPEKEMPKNVYWSYLQENGREYALHPNVGFGHSVEYNISQFGADYRLMQP